MAGAFRYRAFLSYSHRDKAVADRLHRALETYRIPKPLIGTPGRDGPVPAKLFPIFRDREELPTSSDLNSQIQAALEQSAYLIVVCSPHAAASHWVNEEILAFKRMGRANRILAVIASGEPNTSEIPGGDAASECFPKALRYELGENGELGAARTEPIAADLRPEGDGRENVKLKLAAGLLGVGFDALKQRELVAAHRRARIYRAIAASMAVLSVLAVGGGILAYHYALKSQRMAQSALEIASDSIGTTMAISTRMGVSRQATADYLNHADQQLDKLYANGVHTPQLQLQQLRILFAFGNYYSQVSDYPRQLAAAQKAEKLAQNLVETVPNAPAAWAVLSASQKALVASYNILNRSKDAMAWQEKTIDLDRQMVARFPGIPKLRRMLIVDEMSMGNTYSHLGDTAKALSHEQKALAIAQSVTPESAEDRAGLEQIVAAINDMIGDHLHSLNRNEEALAAYRQALQIRKAQSAKDRGNALLFDNVASGETSIGDTQIALKQDKDALASFAAALAIRRQLAEVDPGSANAQQQLGNALEDISRAEARLGMHEEALRDATLAEETLKKVIARAPAGTNWELYLRVAQNAREMIAKNQIPP